MSIKRNKNLFEKPLDEFDFNTDIDVDSIQDVRPDRPYKKDRDINFGGTGSYNFEDKTAVLYKKNAEVVKRNGYRIQPFYFDNHVKLLLGFSKPDYYFIVESSANFNQNPRNELSIAYIDQEMFDFYFGFFSKQIGLKR